MKSAESGGTGALTDLSLASTSFWLRGLDYFFVGRPVLWFPGWATMLAGSLVAIRKGDFLPELGFSVNWSFPGEPGGNVWIALAAFTFAMAGSFILNQLQDVESDKKNGKLFLIGYGLVSRRAGWTETVLLLGGALLLSLSLPIRFVALLIGFVLITGYLYNFPPFAYKNRPIAGLLANMAMGWIAFALGWVVATDRLSPLWAESLPFLFYNSALYLLTTLPDMEGDAVQNKITFPLRFGLPVTLWVSFSFLAASLLSAWWLGSALVLTCSVLLLGPWLYMWRHYSLPGAIVVLKLGILLLLVVVALHVPLLAVLCLSIAGLSRYYYSRRFRILYPTLGGR